AGYSRLRSRSGKQSAWRSFREILLHSRETLRSAWLSNTNQPTMSTAASARKKGETLRYPPGWSSMSQAPYLTTDQRPAKRWIARSRRAAKAFPTDDERRCLVATEWPNYMRNIVWLHDYVAAQRFCEGGRHHRACWPIRAKSKKLRRAGR